MGRLGAYLLLLAVLVSIASALTIQPRGCFPDPANATQQVTCLANVTNATQVNATITLPDLTTLEANVTNNTATNFSFTFSNTTQLGFYNVTWNASNTTTFILANDNFTVIGPSINNLILNATSANNLTSDNLTCNYELNGSATTSVVNWLRNSTPILVLNMPFEGNSTNALKDYSGLQNNANNQGAVWNGTIGYDGRGAFEFDGSSRIVVPFDQSLNFSDPGKQFTLSAWINADSLGSDGGIVGRWQNTGNHQYVIKTESDTNNIKFAVHDGAFQVAESNDNSIVTDTWIFVVGVGNGTHLLTYINGQPSFKTTPTYGTLSIIGTDIDVTIGEEGSPTDNYFDGTLDEVRIWNRSLSAEQVLALYNNRTDLIVSQETKLGENWTCEVTPFSSVQAGTTQTSNTLLVQEIVPPNVTGLIPEAGSTFNILQTIEIAANVTDNTAVDTVLANITFPNSSTQLLTLTNITTNKHNTSFTIPNLPGTYDLTIIANDTFGNINDTETTNFTVLNTPPEVNSSFLNATDSPVNSTRANLTLHLNVTDFNGHSVKNITVWKTNGSSIQLLNMPFEGGSNSTFTKDYALGNNGRVFGATFNSTGGYDGFGAYEFDGDFINFTLDELRNTNGTIFLRFNHGALTTGRFDPDIEDLFSMAQLGYGVEQVTTDGLSGRLYLRVGSSQQQNVFNTVAGQWYSVAVRWSGTAAGSGLADVFINGIFDENLSYSGFSDPTGEANLGRELNQKGERFNGTIDDVLIFNRTLSNAQIRALHRNRTDLIVSQETKVGETWQACTTPNDRRDDGQEVCSNNLTIEDTPPLVTIVTPLGNTFNVSDTIEIAANVTDDVGVDNVRANITFPNSTNTIITLSQASGNKYNTSFQVPLLLGIYNITILANDTAGLLNNTETTNFTAVDDILPTITFERPTLENDTGTNLTFIPVNVTASDNLQLDTIIIFLYNTTGLVQSNISNSSPFFINYTSLADGTYFVNATVNDTSGNLNFTKTRPVIVDTVIPGINFTAPTPPNNSVRAQAPFLNITTNDTNQHYVMTDISRDLLLWLRFDNINKTDGTPLDRSTYQRKTSFNGAGNAPFIDRNGRFGRALFNDNGGDHNANGGIDISSSSELTGMGAISYGGWGRVEDELGSFFEVFMQKNGSYKVQREGDDRMRCQIETTDGTFNVFSTQLINLDTWYFLACTYDGSTLTLHLNDEVQTTPATGEIINSTELLRIGQRDSGGRRWRGWLDEVFIINRSLTSTEIGALKDARNTSYSLNMSEFRSGEHNVTAYAVDRGSNFNLTSVTFTFDITPPTAILDRFVARINATTNTTTLNETTVRIIDEFHLLFNITDDFAGVDNVRLFFRNTNGSAEDTCNAFNSSIGTIGTRQLTDCFQFLEFNNRTNTSTLFRETLLEDDDGVRFSIDNNKYIFKIDEIYKPIIKTYPFERSTAHFNDSFRLFSNHTLQVVLPPFALPTDADLYQLQSRWNYTSGVTQPLEAFLCNRSWPDGNEVQNSPNCFFLDSVTPDDAGLRNQFSWYATNDTVARIGPIVNSSVVFTARRETNSSNYWFPQMAEVSNETTQNNTFFAEDFGTVNLQATFPIVSVTEVHWLYEAHTCFQFFVAANDTFGNTINSSIQERCWQDFGANFPPANPLILVPVNGDLFSGLTNITWQDGEDPDGNTFNITVILKNPDRTANDTLAVVQQGVERFEWDTTTVEDGQYHLNLTSTDPFGAQSSSETATTFTVDNTPPTVIILHPPTGTAVNTNTTNITANVTDLNGVGTVLANITFPNGTTQLFVMSNVSSIYNISINTTETGEYNATIIANDTAGNINDTETTVFERGVAPTLNISVTPTTGLRTDTFTFTANFTDADNDNASFVRLTTDRGTFDMPEVDSTDTDTTDGKLFRISLTGTQVGAGTVRFVVTALGGCVTVNATGTVFVDDRGSGGSSGGAGGGGGGSGYSPTQTPPSPPPTYPSVATPTTATPTQPQPLQQEYQQQAPEPPTEEKTVEATEEGGELTSPDTQTTSKEQLTAVGRAVEKVKSIANAITGAITGQGKGARLATILVPLAIVIALLTIIILRRKAR